ncbi:MAG TPA: hypothetical protein DEQ61_24770, partial [Streptomyces sp.]|nr:hypothetical protein [Streptomyces sp.]
MSAAFTVPAAVRSPRTVAARRAWLVVLFLGGLLGLAVLFGGSAHAASGPETTGSAGTGKVLPSADEAKQRAGQRMEPGVSDAGGAGAVEGTGEVDDARSRKAAEQAAEQTADRAADRTVRPAADGVERIARSAGEPVGDLVGNATGVSQRLPDVGTGDDGREQRSRPDGQDRPGAGTDREGRTPAAGARQPAG